MAKNRVLIIIGMLLVSMTAVSGASNDHYLGEAYLQTQEEISSWTVRNGIVKTGLTWFDQLAQQYSISALREVQISCQINLFFYHIDFDNGNTVDDVCNDFNQNAEVIQAWPVIIPEWYAVPDDEYYGNQWGMTQIDAPTAWDYESGNSSVLIGILDTGADVYDNENNQATVHPDLLNNLWNENGLFGIDVLYPGTDTDDGFGNGTHVAGIAGAVTNNSIGVSGVAGGGFGNGDGVSLLIVRNMDDQGSSSEEDMAESICQALNPDSDWNTNDWVDIINMSWGMKRPLWNLPTTCEQAFPILRTAILDAASKGVVLIAAAGNDFTEYDEQCYNWPYPAGYDEVIAVAATDPDDDHVSSSTQGPFIEVAGPGGVGYVITNVNGGHGIEYDADDIYSTFPRDPFTLQDPNYWSSELVLNIVETNITNNYGYLSGTSMAAPYVSGLAGLILSRFPNYTASDVRNLLQNSAEKAGSNSYDGNGWNKYLGYGRINAGYAIAPPATPDNFYGTGGQGQSPTLHFDPVVEPDIDHLEIHRTILGQGGGNTIFTLPANATQFTDNTVVIGRFSRIVILYKLKSVDVSDQESGFTNTVKYRGEGLWKQMADFELIPDEYALHTAYPNPFNPITTIKYDLPERSRVTMVIYDVLGRTIRTLIQNTVDPGFNEIRWDGKDNKGNPVSTGMYVYRFSAFSQESEKQFNGNNKLVLMK